VAQLAGVSATWYSRLEQKRPIGVSSGVLDNLARVLRLDPAERMQLFQLALRQPVLDPLLKRETVSPLIRRLLDQTDPIPPLSLGVDGTSWRGIVPRSPSFSISSKCPQTNEICFGLSSPTQRCAP
jgi:transcriptional regulator with XRE-family HTH domain